MRAFLGTLALVLVLVAGAAPAAFGSGRDVIRDCTDDERFTKTYTQDEYREALSELSTDTDEYTNCRAAIRRAQLAAAGRRSGGSGGREDGAGNGAGGGKGGGTPSGGSTDATPAVDPNAADSATPTERRALAEVQAGQGRPVDLDGVAVDPTTGTSGPGLGEIPAPLVVLLLGLIAGALVLGAGRIRTLVRTRRA